MSKAGSFCRPRPTHLLAVALSQGARAAGPLAALPLAAHALSAAAFGRLAVSLYAAQVIAVALDGGVAATGYGLLQSTRQGPETLFRHLTALKLIVATGLGALVLVGAALVRFDAATVAAAWLYGAALSLNGFWWLNHQGRTGLLLMSEVAPVAGLLAGSASLAAWRAPWWTPLLGAGVAASLVPLVLAARASPGRLWAFAREDLRLRSQVQVGFTRLLVAAYGLALAPVAALRFDLRAVGAYAACDKVASVAGMAGLIAAQALAPQVSRGALSRPVAKRVWLCLGAAGVVAVAVYLAAAALTGAAVVRLLYGPRLGDLGGGAFVTFAADGLVGVNTLLWSGVLLPLERRAEFGWATAMGAAACYATLFAPLDWGFAQIACARLVGETAVLATSIAILLSLRRRPVAVLHSAGAAA